MNRIIFLTEQKPDSALIASTQPIPKLAKDDVLIANQAIGVNFIDIYQRFGLYPLPDPKILGMESAGVVADIGPDVRSVSIGDRVTAVKPPGAYTDFRVVPESQLIHLPPECDFISAASMMLKGLTVEYLVERCVPLKSGMTVLWHAVGGGVGLIACQWLSKIGVTVIGTASSQSKRERALEKGAHRVFDYADPELPPYIQDMTQGRGVDAVFDGVGQSTFALSLSCLARRGTLVSFGNASGAVEPIAPLELTRSVYLTRPSLMDYLTSRSEIHAASSRLFAQWASGVRVDDITTYPLADVAKAHADLQARKITGSIVLLP